MGPKEAAMLARCEHLQYLRIPGPSRSDELAESMKSLLLVALPHLPALRSICIDRHGSMAQPDWRHRHQWADQLRGPLGAPTAVLPFIEIVARDGKETFMPERSADKASFRYRLCDINAGF